MIELTKHVIERVLGSDPLLVQIAEKRIKDLMSKSIIIEGENRRYAFNDNGVFVLEKTKNILITFISKENLTQKELLKLQLSAAKQKSAA